jgi:hypothetical protein
MNAPTIDFATSILHTLAPVALVIVIVALLMAISLLPYAGTRAASSGQVSALAASTATPVTLHYTFDDDAADCEYDPDYDSGENSYYPVDDFEDGSFADGLLAPGDPGFDFATQGVVYEEGVLYTWYSENVLPGYGLTELNENGRHAGEDGLIRDGEGYIAVASSDHPLGTVLSTPFGFAKVYDTGCPSGNIDVYTNY